MLPVHVQLRERILGWGRGAIFFLDDFADIQSPDSVRMALVYLVGEGFIVRLARGIYCFPKLDEYSMKAIFPSEEVVAQALANKERVRIQPYGDYAAYILGLTRFKVSDLKYLTDGAPRRIRMYSKRVVFFNHTDEAKIFDYCNDTMQLVCSAVRYLKAEGIDDHKARILRERLNAVPEEEFRKDITIPPAWVGEIVRWLRSE